MCEIRPPTSVVACNSISGANAKVRQSGRQAEAQRERGQCEPAGGGGGGPASLAPRFAICDSRIQQQHTHTNIHPSAASSIFLFLWRHFVCYSRIANRTGNLHSLPHKSPIAAASNQEQPPTDCHSRCTYVVCVCVVPLQFRQLDGGRRRRRPTLAFPIRIACAVAATIWHYSGPAGLIAMAKYTVHTRPRRLISLLGPPVCLPSTIRQASAFLRANQDKVANLPTLFCCPFIHH